MLWFNCGPHGIFDTGKLNFDQKVAYIMWNFNIPGRFNLRRENALVSGKTENKFEGIYILFSLEMG